MPDHRTDGPRTEFLQQLGEIPARELPVEWFCDRLVVLLEGMKAFAQQFQRREVIGREDLALNY